MLDISLGYYIRMVTFEPQAESLHRVLKHKLSIYGLQTPYHPLLQTPTPNYSIHPPFITSIPRQLLPNYVPPT